MSYKVNSIVVVDDSSNVCACCVTTCCITATSQVNIPCGTTACRPIGTTGALYYDTELGSVVVHDGTNWNTVGGGEASTQTEPLANSSTESYSLYSFRNANPCGQCKRFLPLCRCYSLPRRCESFYLNSLPCEMGDFLVQAGCCCGTTCLFVEDGAVDFCRIPVPPCANVLYCGICAYLPYQCAFSLCGCPGRFAWAQTFGDGSLKLHGAYKEEIDPYLPYGGVCQGTCQYCTMCEMFFNCQGKISVKNQFHKGLYQVCSADCWYANYNALVNHTYMIRSPEGGAMATVQLPLIMWRRANPVMLCAAFPVTTETFGTGKEETCCYAWRMNKYTYYPQYSRHHLPIPGHCCICIGYNNFLNAVDPVCVNRNYCCPTFFCNCQRLCNLECAFFFSARTDLFGGGSVNCRAAYSTCLTYSCSNNADGLVLKRYDVACCPAFLFTFYSTDGCNCLRQGIAAGAIMLSKDGDCFISYGMLYDKCTAATTYCCCRLDNSYPTCPVCFGTTKRPYIAVLSRTNRCVICVYGVCGLSFTDWQCSVLGCTLGVHCIPRSNYCVYCTVFSSPSTTMPPQAHGCSAATCMNRPAVCAPSGMDLIEASHFKWSRLSNKAYMTPQVMHCIAGNYDYFATFDGVTNMFECSVNLCYRKAFDYIFHSFAMTPQLICTCSSMPPTCFWGGCAGTVGACAFAACVTAITGCCCKDLMTHCLGYSLFSANCCSTFSCCYSCFVSTYGGSISTYGTENNVYINPTNDHLVTIAAFGYNTGAASGTTGIDRIVWVGAICYDITNKCVSKVNTFWPKTELMQYYCCNVYNIAQTKTAAYSEYVTCEFGIRGSVSTAAHYYGIRAHHYGSRKTYIESGCTDHGGIYLMRHGYCWHQACVTPCTVNPCACYFDCNNTGSLLGTCCCCAAMRLDDCTFQISKVPYNVPFECVGWKSEPFFAQMLNWAINPSVSGAPFNCLAFTDVTACKCLYLCLMDGRFSCGFTTKVFSTNCNSWCPIYPGGCMLTPQSLFVFMDSDTPFAGFCYCGSTGYEPATFGQYAKHVQNININCHVQLYDNILPCHLDCCETSKRYVCRFMAGSSSMPYPPEFYQDGRFDYKYMVGRPGEHSGDVMLRVYNENVICCC